MTPSLRNTSETIQQPAGVVAQIKDDTLDRALASGCGQRVEEFLRGALAEPGKANPVVAGLQFAGLHADERDGVALDVQVHGLLRVAVQDGQHGFRPLGAADVGHGFLKRHFHRGLAAHGEDDVAGLHAGLVGGGVLDGSHDGELVVLHRDLHADAVEFAGRAFLHVLEFVLGKHGGVGIEGFEHPLERAVHEVGARGFLHIEALDDVQHLTEALEIVETFEFVGALAPSGGVVLSGGVGLPGSPGAYGQK